MTGPQAQFRFHGALNDFLPPARRQRDISYRFAESPGIKDPIEALGVPHPEVSLILVNTRPVGFGHRLQDGDRVDVYPEGAAPACPGAPPLRDALPAAPAFVLDVHLGKLARTLRLLGFDAAYRNDWDDPAIIACAVRESRVILTRDRRLLFHRVVCHGYWVRATDFLVQAREVVQRFNLGGHMQPFRRCLACNGRITAVDRAEVDAVLQPLTRRYYTTFARCTACRRIYWPGTHYETLVARLGDLLLPDGGGTP